MGFIDLISPELLLAFSGACILLILSPGPDNLLAISRGLSQGKLAAVCSALGTSTGNMVHVMLATFGITLLIQTNPTAFLIAKIIGAMYLIWLGIGAIKAKNLITFEQQAKKSLANIYSVGFLTAALNPKPSLFILAFIPQFISKENGSVTLQMLFLGSWLTLLAFICFAAMGVFATQIAGWFQKRPSITHKLNIGAGIAFILSGCSIFLLQN